MLLLSLHLHSLWKLTVLGHIDVALADVATVLLAMAWFARYFLTGRIAVSRHFLTAFVVAFLFALWIGFEALRSPQPVRGATLWMITCRDLAILWMIGTLLAEQRDLRLLNRLVFLLGVGLAMVSLVFYVGDLRDHSAILTDPSMATEAFEAGVMRLEGFVGDPNFFALFLSVSFLCGLPAGTSRPVAFRWAGLFMIGVALLFSFSRGFLLSLVLSTSVLGVIGTLRGNSLWRRYAAKVLLPLVAVGVGALVVPVPSVGVSPLKWLLARFAVIWTRPSWPAWAKLLPMTLDHPIIGYGLRMGETVLGGHYSHNSYLDLLLETGIVGLCIYSLFVILVIKRGVRLSSEAADVLPWFHACLLTLFMFFFFSILYNPFSWVVAGVILAQSSLPLRTEGS